MTKQWSSELWSVLPISSPLNQRLRFLQMDICCGLWVWNVYRRASSQQIDTRTLDSGFRQCQRRTTVTYWLWKCRQIWYFAVSPVIHNYVTSFITAIASFMKNIHWRHMSFEIWTVNCHSRSSKQRKISYFNICLIYQIKPYFAILMMNYSIFSCVVANWNNIYAIIHWVLAVKGLTSNCQTLLQ